MNLSKLREIVEDREAWGIAVPKSQMGYTDWTTAKINPLKWVIDFQNITRPQDGSLEGMPS